MRLDQNPAHAPDILASIPPLPPAVLDTRWDVIELIHGIEHFWLWDVKLLLTGIHSALASGGTLVLEQPNITVAARILAGVEPSTTPELIQSTMWPLYGDPAHRDEGYMHRWGYTPDTLVALLKECAPWSSITVLPQQYHTYARGRDFRVEAVRW